MAKFPRFNYPKLEDLAKDIQDGNYQIPLSTDISALTHPIRLPFKTAPNTMVNHPMEGCDGNRDGSPSELTIRRYQRFAAGGAGLIWVEATAVTEMGRANPRQLWITKENVHTFKALIQTMKDAAKESMGPYFEPYFVLQLTHSGRYARPVDKPQPVIAHHNEYLDPKLKAEAHLVTDEELMALEDEFANAAHLAQEAGFDAVDIKSCHRYLINGLLSAYNRDGNYGGSFENRTRFFRNVVTKVMKAVGDKTAVTSRLNAFDGIPHPHGFGVNKDNHFLPDLTEPIQLMRQLYDLGMKFINISIGNPYYNPHFGRPFDFGVYIPPETQLRGTERLLNVMGDLKKAVPEMIIIGTGYSWLRHYGAHVAAGCIDQGYCDMAGFGRQSFAYPDFPKDVIEDGCMHFEKCCITCSKCTEIMRDHGTTGCVVRDAKTYMPIYRSGREGKPPQGVNEVKEHI